ncbi:unnamed protein product [Sphenostylis stenocarpa]|uniref:Uncharacterized protein n=1 Tax=Sphenostylis stenocarpa TaxID=92480 RepID=A0AA86TQN2_9FABA|nr:unnamed protein product [Sphenostylis stenocarpa]
MAPSLGMREVPLPPAGFTMPWKFLEDDDRCLLPNNTVSICKAKLKAGADTNQSLICGCGKLKFKHDLALNFFPPLSLPPVLLLHGHAKRYLPSSHVLVEKTTESADVSVIKCLPNGHGRFDQQTERVVSATSADSNHTEAVPEVFETWPKPSLKTNNFLARHQQIE